MRPLALTERQQQAVEATGRSVIVSAAAGSGKTAVLARRCAYLVCDAPPEVRCDVDQLLVLTFTDAAAAEMRARILEAIRQRLATQPDDPRLRRQIALCDAAQISTIHAFCLWMIRRWFSRLAIDPLARVMDDSETRVLKSDVLDQLLVEQYESEPAFTRLVDVYGLGDDRDIARFVLSLFDFTRSLPEPDEWLDQAHQSLEDAPETHVIAMAKELQRELDRQVEDNQQTVAHLAADDASAHFYVEQIFDYIDRLERWSVLLAAGTDDDFLTRFEAVRGEIAAFEFDRTRAPRLPKDAPDGVKAARDRASACLSHVKRRLFGERLRKRFGLFSLEEALADLRRTAPYVRTITRLILAFDAAYSAKKRGLGIMDFADLERFAFTLLRSDENADKPSDTARSLQARFAHVLVDEFQDINPIQHAILRLTSRESNADQPDNLFVVGDIKQSIYRFRLAQPDLFVERLNRFRDPDGAGTTIPLQQNFRSRAEILDAVNVVFRGLMRDARHGVVYDAQAELRPGREGESHTPTRTVDFHLLERDWKCTASEDPGGEDGPPAPDPLDPSRWTVIQREAFLIGSQIREWRESGSITVDDRPLQFKDVAVLLRAKKHNADQVAAALTSMGIPAFADAAGSLLESREARDVLAALRLLDNQRQDIPLASVLRSGIFGVRLGVDQLAEIRCLDRNVEFHEAVHLYADTGPDKSLREETRSFLGRVTRYRNDAQRRPLDEVLWKIYHQGGYLAHLGGLPGGVARRANLLKLHEFARQFGSFRQQGLHRFLGFLEQLEEEDQGIAVAPSVAEGDNVVRIMSIHQAKGLEFPVVFLAGLGTKLNLGDRNGRMIYEPRTGIGLRVVDTQRMIEYPSLAHTRVAVDIENATRDEELRVLYVAMTRAEQKLVLVGSMADVHRADVPDSSGGPFTPSRLQISSAVTPLDWLLPAVLGSSRVAAFDAEPPEPNEPLFLLHRHDVQQMSAWRMDPDVDNASDATRRAVARWQPLGPHEPVAHDDPEVDAVLDRVDFVYPYLGASTFSASVAAGEVKRPYEFWADPDEAPTHPSGADFEIPPSKYDTSVRDDASHRGLVTHRVLQLLDFDAAVDAQGLASELQRLEASGMMAPGDRDRLDEPALAWFLSTPLADAIRTAGKAYRREFLFVATEPLSDFAPGADASGQDRVLVRGIVDGILPADGGIEIVDFKTDAVGKGELAQRTEHHRPQLELYARAAERIWQKPALRCWLVFLTPRELVEWMPSAGKRGT